MTVEELVAASRAQQGLPPKVADPATITRLAALLAPPLVSSKRPGPDRHSGRATTGGRDATRPPSL